VERCFPEVQSSEAQVKEIATMRRFRFRLSVRSMMIFVAVTAFTIFVGAKLFQMSIRPIALEYQKRAASHGRLEHQWNEWAESTAHNYFTITGPAGTPALPWPGAKIMLKDDMQKRAAYHAALKAKYERASRQPWVEMSPDPPPP
jgi:hypothetical protein